MGLLSSSPPQQHRALQPPPPPPDTPASACARDFSSASANSPTSDCCVVLRPLAAPPRAPNRALRAIPDTGAFTSPPLRAAGGARNKARGRCAGGCAPSEGLRGSAGGGDILPGVRWGSAAVDDTRDLGPLGGGVCCSDVSGDALLPPFAAAAGAPGTRARAAAGGFFAAPVGARLCVVFAAFLDSTALSDCA